MACVLEEESTSDDCEPYSLQQGSQNINSVTLGGRQPDRQEESKGVEREQVPGSVGAAARRRRSETLFC